MRIAYLPDGSPLPLFEAGDMVRPTRDEPGEAVTARPGDWGEVQRNAGTEGIDICLAGYSRPRRADLPVATRIPASILVPCDRAGLRFDLRGEA